MKMQRQKGTSHGYYYCLDGLAILRYREINYLSGRSGIKWLHLGLAIMSYYYECMPFKLKASPSEKKYPAKENTS